MTLYFPVIFPSVTMRRFVSLSFSCCVILTIFRDVQSLEVATDRSVVTPESSSDVSTEPTEERTQITWWPSTMSTLSEEDANKQRMANIRHQKSRRYFARARKSAKIRPSDPDYGFNAVEQFSRMASVTQSSSSGTGTGTGLESAAYSVTTPMSAETSSTEPQTTLNSPPPSRRLKTFSAASTTPLPTPYATTLRPYYRTTTGAPNLENKLRVTGDLVDPIYPDDDLYDDASESPLEDTDGDGVGDEEEDDSGQLEEQQEQKQRQPSASSVKRDRIDVDIVTKFLHIVESQHLLGENCTAGTDFNLGEGVVDRYAQERFRLEGDVAVNRANMLTRLWKYDPDVMESEYFLHASVISMVEFDDDIFAAGNCYDKYEYKDYWLYCPFAFRLPEGPVLAKDLAVEYKYLSNTSEWFYIARKNAERVIINYTQFKRAYNTYTYNESAHTERVADEILSVTYEDGKWSKPYFDCGGGNIWMMTYTVPFFGYRNDTYFFKGTSGIDIDLRRVDIDQCPLPLGSTQLNIFAASDKCKEKTTMCVPLPGLGFRRGSYKCVCRVGYYFPDKTSPLRYYNGTVIEEEYEKKLLGEETLYDVEGMFGCLPCAEGCETCEDDRLCIVTLNWVMRTSILTLSSAIMCCLPVVGLFTWKYGEVKVVRAASPVLLRVIILGAFFIYCTIIVTYPRPTLITCTLRIWLREIGFSLSYGALMLKTWRISVIFRVRSAKAVKITDLDLLKRLGIIVGVFSLSLVIRTLVDPPHVIVGRTADDLKAFLCQTNWWDHSFTIMEMMFLVWGIRLCIVVRKAPSEFNESKFISLAIYNEFLLSVFLNISMLFLQSPANPDLLYIIFFCHVQLTITLLLCLIFGSKAYLVLKGQGKGEESLCIPKPQAAKFLTKPKSANSFMAHSSTTSTSHGEPHALLSDVDVQEELKRIYFQMEQLKETNMRLGNRSLVAKLNAMQEAAKKDYPSIPSSDCDKNNTDKDSSKATGSIVPIGLNRKCYGKGDNTPILLTTSHLNNVLANVTDKIVCATFSANSPEALQQQAETEADCSRKILNSSGSRAVEVIVEEEQNLSDDDDAEHVSPSSPDVPSSDEAAVALAAETVSAVPVETDVCLAQLAEGESDLTSTASPTPVPTPTPSRSFSSTDSADMSRVPDDSGFIIKTCEVASSDNDEDGVEDDDDDDDIEDKTVKSALNTPVASPQKMVLAPDASQTESTPTLAPNNSATVINVDDKNRFTEEVTV